MMAKPRKGSKTHHAWVDEATESDNQTWVYITCDPHDRFVNALRYSKNWTNVDCKNCLRMVAERKGKEKP